MNIAYAAKALKQLAKLDIGARRQIVDKVSDHAARGVGDVKALQGMQGVFRLRCGDYRIVFGVQDQTITVAGIGHRRDIYR